MIMENHVENTSKLQHNFRYRVFKDVRVTPSPSE